ncbi:MAG: hypothetical protein SGJ20_20675 [Planctomycetota bacterium]|nr:hypothetical protein [Planctomycetota bacterium]
MQAGKPWIYALIACASTLLAATYYRSACADDALSPPTTANDQALQKAPPPANLILAPEPVTRLDALPDRTAGEVFLTDDEGPNTPDLPSLQPPAPTLPASPTTIATQPEPANAPSIQPKRDPNVRPVGGVSAAPPIKRARQRQPAAIANKESTVAATGEDAANLEVKQVEDQLAVPAVRIDPIAFQEVTPGNTSLAEIEAKWGDPSQDTVDNGTGRQVYHVEPFRQIDVTFQAGVVNSLVVHLEAPVDADEVTKPILGDDTRFVEVLDDRDQSLGIVYPERGILFSFAPGKRQVAQILLESVDTESFLLRAEQSWQMHPRQSMADLEYVLSQQSKNAKAHWLMAKLYLEAGRLAESAKSIESACTLSPENSLFLITKARILSDSGDFTEGGRISAGLLPSARLPPVIKAQAHCLTGDILANGPDRNVQKALEHHLAAIKLAQPLLTSDSGSIRRMAKLVTVEANLGAANDIAWGHWQQKEKVVPKWIIQAHVMAEDLIENEHYDEALHLRVVRRALAASAGTQGQIDPVEWTKEALATGRSLIEQTDDSWRRYRLEWETGLALYDSLQADQARGYHEHALTNSALVVKYLTSAAEHRQQTPHENYLLGRLNFRVGAIHAVDKGDHQTASIWYAKAVPLLERPLPATAVADIGQLGETFVSIGISYWQIGRKDEAIRLTQYGVDLVSQAVKQRMIGKDALVVPYSNLAFMHHALGNAELAAGFEAMATRVDEVKRR